MLARELYELNRLMDEEKKALMKGAVEEILKWSSHKVRLLHLLKDKELTPEEREILKEIYEKNERNRRLIEAGLNFVEEAYRLLNSLLIKKEVYGKEGSSSTPRVISKEI